MQAKNLADQIRKNVDLVDMKYNLNDLAIQIEGQQLSSSTLQNLNIILEFKNFFQIFDKSLERQILIWEVKQILGIKLENQDLIKEIQSLFLVLMNKIRRKETYCEYECYLVLLTIVQKCWQQNQQKENVSSTSQQINVIRELSDFFQKLSNIIENDIKFILQDVFTKYDDSLLIQKITTCLAYNPGIIKVQAKSYLSQILKKMAESDSRSIIFLDYSRLVAIFYQTFLDNKQGVNSYQHQIKTSLESLIDIIYVSASILNLQMGNDELLKEWKLNIISEDLKNQIFNYIQKESLNPGLNLYFVFVTPLLDKIFSNLSSEVNHKFQGKFQQEMDIADNVNKYLILLEQILDFVKDQTVIQIDVQNRLRTVEKLIIGFLPVLEIFNIFTNTNSIKKLKEMSSQQMRNSLAKLFIERKLNLNQNQYCSTITNILLHLFNIYQTLICSCFSQGFISTGNTINQFFAQLVQNKSIRSHQDLAPKLHEILYELIFISILLEITLQRPILAYSLNLLEDLQQKIIEFLQMNRQNRKRQAEQIINTKTSSKVKNISLEQAKKTILTEANLPEIIQSIEIQLKIVSQSIGVVRNQQLNYQLINSAEQFLTKILSLPLSTISDFFTQKMLKYTIQMIVKILEYNIDERQVVPNSLQIYSIFCEYLQKVDLDVKNRKLICNLEIRLLNSKKSNNTIMIENNYAVMTKIQDFYFGLQRFANEIQNQQNQYEVKQQNLKENIDSVGFKQQSLNESEEQQPVNIKKVKSLYFLDDENENEAPQGQSNLKLSDRSEDIFYSIRQDSEKPQIQKIEIEISLEEQIDTSEMPKAIFD